MRILEFRRGVVARDRKKLITFLIIDILVIVFIACNAQFGILGKIVTALNGVLNPEPEYVAPKRVIPNLPDDYDDEPSQGGNQGQGEEPGGDEPGGGETPEEPSIYPIKVTFDAMGGTIQGSSEVILDGENMTVADLTMPIAEFGEFEFLRWEKEEREEEQDGEKITIWDYYVVWNYRPVGYYTKILSAGDFELQAGVYYTIVGEAQTTYDVLSEFIIRDTFAEINLYSSSTCDELDRVEGDIDLNYGDNFYWIKIDAGENGERIEKINVYRQKAYTITFNKNGGSGASTATVYNNANHYVFPDSEKAGYEFYGWYYDQECISQPVPAAIDVTSDVVVYAGWSDPIHYTISYVPNGETYTGTMPTGYTVVSQFTLPASASKEGYTFNYWKINNVKYSSSKTYTGDLTVTAQFTEISYKITYVLNGGTNNSNNKAASTYSNTSVTLYNPTKIGYTFLGWYYDSGFTSPCESTITVTSATTIYAKWSAPIEYSIAYTPAEGVTLDGVMPTTYTIASQPTIPNASKAGYDFIGWWLDEGNNVMYDSSVTYHENLSFAPRFEIITYSIEYDYKGGEAQNEAEYTVEDYPTLNVPIRKGFVFDSWEVYDEDDNPLVYDSTFKYLKNIKMVATYTALLDGDYGKYPQKLVTDAATISALNGVTPVDGIYTYADKEYVKIVAHPFMDGVTFTNGSEVVYGQSYYFELLPIEWIVVQKDSNEYILTTKYILDAGIFDTETHVYADAAIKTQTETMLSQMLTDGELFHAVELEDGVSIRIISSDEIDSTYMVAQATDYAIARGCYYNPDNYNAFYFYLDEEVEERPEYALGYRSNDEGENLAPLYIESECGIRPIIKVISGEED